MTKKLLTIGSANGGTTAFSKCFAQIDDIHVMSSAIQKGYGVQGFFADTPENYGSKIIYNKETVGVVERNFPIFPKNLSTYADELYLIFLYREPKFVLNSWKNRNWVVNGEGEKFIVETYQRLEELQKQAEQEGIRHQTVIFNEFLKDPQAQLEYICSDADIAFSEDMTCWTTDWGDRRGKQGNPLIDSRGLQKTDAPETLKLTQQELAEIEKIQHIYEKTKTKTNYKNYDSRYIYKNET